MKNSYRHAALPSFGPFGTAGQHCFDPDHPVYRRIAALNAVRRAFPALRYGRQYARAVRFLDRPFALHGPGELTAWSRILDDEELLCVLNPHGVEARGADVIVRRQAQPDSRNTHRRAQHRTSG